jgi:two-component system NtrC family sensor kinase
MVAWVVAVSLAPLLVCAAVLGYQFHTAYRAKVVAQLEELVLKHKQGIGSFLRESAAELRVLTRLVPFADFQSDAKLAALLATMQTEHGGVFVDLGLVDGSGALLAYAGPFRLGKADYADSPWFAAAKSKDIAVSDVFLGLRGLPHFVLTVRRTHDDRTYFVRSSIDFAAFNNLVENIGQGATGQAFILNAKGEFQTTPKKGRRIDASFLREHIWEASGTPRLAEGRGHGLHPPRPGHRPGRRVRGHHPQGTDNGPWSTSRTRPTPFRPCYRARMLALAIVALGAVGTCSRPCSWPGAWSDASPRRYRARRLQRPGDRGRQAGLGRGAGRRHRPRDQQSRGHHDGEAGWVWTSWPTSTAAPRKPVRNAPGPGPGPGPGGGALQGHHAQSFKLRAQDDSRLRELDINDLAAEMAELSEKRARYVNVAPGAPSWPRVCPM